MRRAALIALLAVVPLALVLFPRFRRALARRARGALLVVSGVGVLGGAWRLFWNPATSPLTPIEWVVAFLGWGVLTAAFVAVAADAARGRGSGGDG